MQPDTLIIIPAFNEGRNIAGVIGSIRDLYPHMDIAVINDGSVDDTAREAKEAGAVVLSHPFNMGYGISLQTGYKYAMRLGYRFLVQIDGDGQHDPEGIGLLHSTLRESPCDIVLGSRFLLEGNYRPSIFRRIGIRTFSLILRILSGRNISDVTTGFQAMNRKVLGIFVSDVFPCDYPDADVIMMLSMMGMKIREAPVRMYPNPDGKSMHRNPLRVLYYVFKMVLSMLLTRIRKYPAPEA